ncbi:Zinc transporter ZitB [Streptomyces hirsutus]
MGAGHDHGHAHGAHPGGTASAAYRGRLRAALAITLGVMVVEIIGGLLADSLALVADAAHMATDALGLGMALLAIHFANRPPSAHRTFGYARAEILAALANCLLLLGVGGYVLYEAIQRFIAPAPTEGGLTQQPLDHVGGDRHPLAQQQVPYGVARLRDRGVDGGGGESPDAFVRQRCRARWDGVRPGGSVLVLRAWAGPTPLVVHRPVAALTLDCHHTSSVGNYARHTEDLNRSQRISSVSDR